MPTTINRDALIVFPKQPLLDWVNSVFDDNKMECPELLAHDKGNIYLIPETDNHEAGVELVKKSFQFFFEEELFSWCTDENLWPKPLTWELFQQFFHFSIQSVVLDTIEAPLQREAY